MCLPFTYFWCYRMNPDSNKIDDFMKIAELDSNLLAESLKNEKSVINILISIISKMRKETELDSKSSTGFKKKVTSRLKNLLNKLNQACSLGSLRKCMAQVRELTAEFTQLKMQFTHNDTMALHCLHAINILEGLILHVTTKEKDKVSSHKEAKYQNLYTRSFEHTGVPSHLTNHLVYAVQHGANRPQASSGQV